MIRIIDEPVFELTSEENDRLLTEYTKRNLWSPQTFDTKRNLWSPQTFEQWLVSRGMPHTVLGRIKP